MENTNKSIGCDASNVELRAVVGTSSFPHIAGKELSLDPDGIIQTTVYGFVSSGTFHERVVEGLPGFGRLLDSFSERQFTVLGTAEALKTGEPTPFGSKSRPVSSGFARDKQHFFLPERPLVVYFDLDRPANVPAPAIEDTRARLIHIMSELAEVGFLVRGSAKSGVFKKGDAEPVIRCGGERWYFVLKDGSRLPNFARAFYEKATSKGYVKVKIDKAGRRRFAVMLDDWTEVDVSVFSPERIDFNGPNRVSEGLSRKRWPAEFIPGDLLDAGALTVSPVEEATSAALRSEFYDAAKDEAAAVAEKWRQAHGRKLPKTTGKAAVETLKRHDRKLEEENKGLSKSGFPIVHFTLGHMLDFEQYGVVDVADVLRDPNRYDGLQCCDPLDPSKGYKGIFYADSMQVFSFASGGYLVKLVKCEVIFNHDHPLQTMNQIDEIVGSGVSLDLFSRGGELGQVDRKGISKPVAKELLSILVCRLIAFKEWRQNRQGGFDLVPLSPSTTFWLAYSSRTDLGLPNLRGIRSCPIYYKGRVVKRRGFDIESGLFLTQDFRINDFRIKKATRTEAIQALELINGVFKDIPFREDKDRAALLAAILAGIQRPLLGCVPLFMFAASTPGTGKTQLEASISIIATGTHSQKIAYRDDANELDKTLLSLYREAAPVICFDNVNGNFGGDALCMALTALEYSGRMLGLSKTARFPTTDTLLMATGNNPMYFGDMPRRTIEVVLDARMERPELRKFDKTLVEICTERRIELLEACLIILSAFHNEKPAVEIQPMGGFETFSREIAACVCWLTGVDVSQCKPANTADDKTALLAEFLHTWRSVFGSRVLTVADACEDYVFKAWAATYFGDRFGVVNTRSLGRFIAKSKQRIVDGLTVYPEGVEHGRQTWRVSAA